MKKLILLFAALCCMAVADAQSVPPNNQIWYTTTDGQKCTPQFLSIAEGVTLVSNEYDASTGKGVITYDNDVASVTGNYFQNKQTLKSVIFPNSLQKLDNYVFYECSNLESVILSNSMQSIGVAAFSDCSSLDSINIQGDVATIDVLTFQNCSSLKSVSLPASLTTIDSEAFSQCVSLDSISIPDNVTEIWTNAFLGCTNLKSISLPSALTYIGADAFNGCSSLDSISIPTGVTVITEETFRGCTGLKSVTMPRVTNISNGAFLGCTGLETITLPCSLTDIGDKAFGGCTSLKSIYAMPLDAPQLSSRTFNDVNTSGVVLYVHSPENYSGWPFKAQPFTTMVLHKQSLLGSIEAAMQGVTLSADNLAAVQTIISQIKAMPDDTTVTDESLATLDKLAINALAIVNYLKLRSEKDSAIAVIETALDGTNKSDYLTQLAQEYITYINAQSKTDMINAAIDKALNKITVIGSAYNDIINAAHGTMGTKQSGPALRVTDKNGKEVILYSPKSVEYIKVK
ncbi:MAG: leucine-rich repeat domain-containing protein [Bacteroidales bacterium]|nr:leucine-rich repeat domain-containing protein [Candidatus Sodaliphilus aphodohippi]